MQRSHAHVRRGLVAVDVVEAQSEVLSRGEVRNLSDTEHPFHLHGHTYQHAGGGPRKDTSIVLPNQTLDLEFDADNPGQWMTHCHNIYHGEAGMMTVLAYRP